MVPVNCPLNKLKLLPLIVVGWITLYCQAQLSGIQAKVIKLIQHYRERKTT